MSATASTPATPSLDALTAHADVRRERDRLREELERVEVRLHRWANWAGWDLSCGEHAAELVVLAEYHHRRERMARDGEAGLAAPAAREVA